MFSGLHIATSGLDGQTARMNVIAQNIANVETTRTPGGGPYQRQVVQLETTGEPGSAGVRVAANQQDGSAGPSVYNPSHPDADATGYVRMPNVDMTDENMDLMNARRNFEANITVYQAMKSMLSKAVKI